jgi:ABC-type proline/glycine betaine transport system permease subunit
MKPEQKIIVAAIIMGSIAMMVSGAQQVWSALARLSVVDAATTLGILLTLSVLIWLLHRAYFARYIDPIIHDSIASLQKNLGITQR